MKRAACNAPNDSVSVSYTHLDVYKRQLVYLFRQKGAYHLNFRKLKIYGTVLKEIIRVGIPAGIQSLVITLSNVFAQYHINGFNVDAIAAFTAYFKVELPIYLPIVAFGQAITIFSGQNIGAKMCIRDRF